MTVKDAIESVSPKIVNKNKLKKRKNEFKTKSNVSSPGESPKGQSQSRKRKSVQDSLPLENEGNKNKVPKLEANANEDQTDVKPANTRKDRFKTKPRHKKQSKPVINDQSVTDANKSIVEAKPKGNKVSTPMPEKSESTTVASADVRGKPKGIKRRRPKPKTDKPELLTTDTSTGDVKTPPKKNKKKGSRKKIKVNPQPTDQDQKSKCLEYLNKWKNDRKNWRFEKIQQGRLFQMIFEKEMVPEESYEIFLDYMSKASESSKTILKSKANDIISETEKWESLSEEEKSSATAPDKNKYERARSVLQHFQ